MASTWFSRLARWVRFTLAVCAWPVEVPALHYPGPMRGVPRARPRFAGTTADGETSTVYPPPLHGVVRY